MTKKQGWLSRAAGFTMPEIIIMVAVMAIITGMAFPDLVSFLQRQQLEQEIDAQKELSKALDAYSKACHRLPSFKDNPNKSDCSDPDAPSDKLTWYDALAQFTNLDGSAIQKDVWGNPRRYTMMSESVNYREGPLDFYYAEIRSGGPNQCDDAGASTTCNSPSSTLRQRQDTLKSFSNDTSGGAGDFSLDAGESDYFGKVGTVGDDLLIKYTDNQTKTQLYNETMDRMHRVIDALDRYAQGKFNEVTLTGDPCVSEEVFYPPSSISGSSGTYDGNGMPADPNWPSGCSAPTSANSKYPSAVTDDVSNITDNPNIDGMSDTNDTRKTAMQGLMRVLGLPEADCCSALTGHAFFYASSPQAFDGGSCMKLKKPPYLPPKISIKKDNMCP